MSDPNLSPFILREVYPGTNITSDADIWNAIAGSAESFHHPVSPTCTSLPSVVHLQKTN